MSSSITGPPSEDPARPKPGHPDPERGGSERPSDPRADFVDASRRTELAGERTYLAWLRSGLGALAVGLGVGKLLPELDRGPTWPFVLLGTSFALLGLALFVYGMRRARAIDRALAEGRYERMEERALFAVTSLAVALSIATLALIVLAR